MTQFHRAPGALQQLGSLARGLGAERVLVVSEPGIIAAGHVGRAVSLLAAAGVEARVFSDFGENPDTAAAERGRAYCDGFAPQAIVSLGGGSSLDCGKAINFVHSNGGHMRDYWGYGKLTQPLLPSIGIPTSTGTGSESQTYCVISDAETKRKMACGDPKAAFAHVILDVELCLTQPFATRAAAGFDALIHAVETWVTAKRTPASQTASREAWQLLAANYERVLEESHDREAMDAMQWGAMLAGRAIELSMLGATHACANPLTQRYGLVHGGALAVLAPHVIRFNREAVHGLYEELSPDLEDLLARFRAAGRLPSTLRELGVAREHLPALADAAAEQWTGRFNPRSFDRTAALEIYECAY